MEDNKSQVLKKKKPSMINLFRPYIGMVSGSMLLAVVSKYKKRNRGLALLAVYF